MQLRRLLTIWLRIASGSQSGIYVQVDLTRSWWPQQALEDFNATLPQRATLNTMAVMIDHLDHLVLTVYDPSARALRGNCSRYISAIWMTI